MNIDIIPITEEDTWAYGGWDITKEPDLENAVWYSLHSPNPETAVRRFRSQEEALRHLESEVNFEAELVLESQAMRTLGRGGYGDVNKVYSMSRVSGGGATREAAAHILEGPGKAGYLLNPRFDLCNHSPTGFEWGYGGSGPAQLALAILADALDSDRLAVRLHQQFKFAWVSPWGEDLWWMVSQLHVACWALERIRADRQSTVVRHVPA